MEQTMPESAARREDTVTAYVVAELGCLDGLLEDLGAAVVNGRLSEARALVRRFELALEQHVRVEEDLLLPVFEARTGVDGPAATLRAEHRDAERGARLMREALATDDLAGFDDGLRFLRQILPGHNSKEHILYPAVDMLLSEPERARLMQRLKTRP